MRPQRYHIRFPADNLTRASQAEAYFMIMEHGEERRIQFHDYADIYNHPGLYKQLFYQRLKCTSPAKLTELLRDAAAKAGDDPTQMHVLDVGAGGYGQPILTGIRLDNIGLIMEGAVPAALLALAMQGVFEVIEHELTPRGLQMRAQS